MFAGRTNANLAYTDISSLPGLLGEDISLMFLWMVVSIERVGSRTAILKRESNRYTCHHCSGEYLAVYMTV